MIVLMRVMISTPHSVGMVSGLACGKQVGHGKLEGVNGCRLCGGPPVGSGWQAILVVCPAASPFVEVVVLQLGWGTRPLAGSSRSSAAIQGGRMLLLMSMLGTVAGGAVGAWSLGRWGL